MPRVPKTSLQYLCNIWRKAWRMKLVFCPQRNTKCFFKLVLSFCVTRHAQIIQNSNFAIYLEHLKRKVSDKVDFFLHADKHENLILWFFDEDGQPFPKFPRLLICTVFTISRKKLDMKLIFCMQINIKVSYKVIIPLLMGIIKHSQSTQSIKCAISQKRS